MARGMGNSLPIEKLDMNHYASWAYKMHQYLLGHGYLSYVEGANDAALDVTHKDFSAWEHATSIVMYCFMSSVGDELLSYIRDAKMLKYAWANLKRVFAMSTTAKKLQLMQELNNVQQKYLFVADYTTRMLCTHNIGEGRSRIFTLVKGMFTIIKKGTKDWIE